MSSRYRKHRLMALFCAFGFILCLWLGHFSSTTLQVQIGELTVAQNSNPSQLVQKGIDSYRLEDFQKAIQLWNEALKFYSNNPVNEAIVRENLARAYPQVGQTKEAIDNWGQVISLYQRLGSGAPQQDKINIEEKIAKAKIELAQVYSSIGQPKKAITLLCSFGENGKCPKNDAKQDRQTKIFQFQFASSIQDTNLKVAVLGSLGDAYRLTGENDYQEAINYLEEGLKTAPKQKNPYITSLTNSLGNTYSQQALLNYRRSLSPVGSRDDTEKFRKSAICSADKAWSFLQESRDNAKLQEDKRGQIQAILSLSNLYKKFDEIQKDTGAINFDCEEDSFQTNIKFKDAKEADVQSLLDNATGLIKELPNNRTKIYTTVNFINLRKDKARCIPENFDQQAQELLDNAVDIAKTFKDNRAKSFALGEKGNIYECRQEYANAIDFTEQARTAAEKGKSLDSLYLWEWQTGRILRDQKKTEEAIKAYEQAISTLEGSSRSDILTANRDIQFDFRDTVEVIYRDLVAMKLGLINSIETSSKSVNHKNSESNFNSILKTIDSLKLAELQNYFGDNCNLVALNQGRDNLQNAKTEGLLRVSNQSKQYVDRTAFISTFILEDETAVILTLPNGQPQISLYHKKRQEVENEINEFRRNIQSTRGRAIFNDKLASNIYNWIIRDFEILQKTNDENNIDTIVFIQDGILRNVPMAALYDSKNKQFLIERYAIAVIPSFSLTKPELMNRKNLRTLALGLSQEATVDGKLFKALPNVIEEIKGVLQKVSGQKLLDKDFTANKLEQELERNSYSIIHVATHGQFGIRPEDTFIVTGDNNKVTADNNKVTGNKNKITFNELDKIIRQFNRNTEALELLALTACETATGDSRSTLGLGGVAVQAGAKSALASLWVIDDGIAAKVAVDFYDELLRNTNVSKAKALQSVLVKFIKKEKADGNDDLYSHPKYWSPFVIIGNWL